MGQVHVLTGIVRRRRWSDEQKRALVAEAFAPGAVLAEVARRADVNTGQLYRWRRDLASSGLRFAPVVVSGGAGSGLPAATEPGSAVIDVAAGDGARVRIPVSVSPELAAAIVKAVVGR